MNPDSATKGTPWVVGQTLFLATLAVIPPLMRGHWPAAISFGIGSGLVLYAAWSGISGVRHLGSNRTPSPMPLAGSELVTTGIYSRLRHPLYASMMALGLGWAMLWSSTAGLAVAAGFCLFLHAKARCEETLLNARFPEYAAYAGRVPRYFPASG